MGLLGVDRKDAGVGVGAAQDLADEHAGQREIGTEVGAACDLIDAVGAHRALADPFEVLILAVHSLLPSHLGGRRKDRADNLVITRTAAEIPRQPEAHLGLRGIGLAVQEGLGGDQETRRAVPALERRFLQEEALQGMQGLALGHALDGLNRTALCLDAQRQAGTGHPTVHDYAASAAIARRAAFLAARQVKFVA